MSGREIRKNERKEDTSKDNEAKKPNRMLDALNKMGLAKPLAASVMTVATSALLAVGCTASDRPERDSQTEEDADGDPMQVQLPPLVVDVPPKIPHDAETDGDVVEDGVEDSIGDVPEDLVEDAVEEEMVEPICGAITTSRTVTIHVGITTNLGGIGVRYDGPTTSGDAEYSILCGDVVVRSGIEVTTGSTEVVDVSEHAFTVELTPSSATSDLSRVTITVTPY